MRTILISAVALLFAGQANAVVFAKDNYLATVDSANSSVKFGDRYNFGWGGWTMVPWYITDRFGDYKTANVSGQFGVTAEYSYDYAAPWELYTRYETKLIFDNIQLQIDNPSIVDTFKIPELSIKADEYRGLNPNYDPYYNYQYGYSGVFMWIVNDLYPPILEKITDISIDGDLINIGGNTGGGHFDEVFVFDLQASLVLAKTGEAADFLPLEWDDGSAKNRTQVGVSAVPLPASVLLIGPVFALGAAHAANRRRNKVRHR